MSSNRIHKNLMLAVMCILLCLPLQGSAQQVDLSNESLYALISPSDLYCSFFIWEGEYPATRITGWENRESRVLLKDGDLVYLNKGSADGMERGQVYLILNIGPKIKKYGHLTFQTGRVRITQVTKDKSNGTIRTHLRNRENRVLPRSIRRKGGAPRKG